MAVQLNVNNFKNLIKRGSVNHVIDNVKLIFTPQLAVSSMRGTDLISCVKVDNNILTGLKKADVIDFCFVNPLSNVLPYLEILRGDNVNVKIEDGYLELAEPPHTVKISLFHQNVVTPFDSDRQPKIEFFVQFNPDERFANFIDKTKRVCASHGRIYLGTKGGFLYIRAGGAANELTSEIKLNLVETDFEIKSSDGKEIELNFNYKSFINMIGLINQDFSVSVAFDDDQDLGLIKAAKGDNGTSSEYYYLMSRI
jgi:hypothetical protein